MEAPYITSRRTFRYTDPRDSRFGVTVIIGPVDYGAPYAAIKLETPKGDGKGAINIKVSGWNDLCSLLETLRFVVASLEKVW